MTLKTSNTHKSFIDDDSSHLFEMVFNQQFQFMAILSSEGRVLEINNLALTMQGAKREDYIGKFFWESPAWANHSRMERHMAKTPVRGLLPTRPLNNRRYLPNSRWFSSLC